VNLNLLIKVQLHDLMICFVFRLHPLPSAIPNEGNEKNCENTVSIFKLF